MYYSYAPSGLMAMPFPHWEEDTPQNQVRLQKLQHFIWCSSQTPILCEDDFLQYYEQFMALSNIMTRARFLTSEERDTAFWCGFHPDDRSRLLPYPPSTPPHFEDVFTSACTAFSAKALSIPLCPYPPSPPTMLDVVPIPYHPHVPYPSPERTPEIRRPASTPPICQHFNDLGERVPQPPPMLASPVHTTSEPHSPSLAISLPTPEPSPALPIRSLSLPCDLQPSLPVHDTLPPCSLSPTDPIPTSSPICPSSQPYDASLPLFLPLSSVLTTSSSPSSPTKIQSPSLHIPLPSPACPTCPSSLHDPSPFLSPSLPVAIDDALPPLSTPDDPPTAPAPAHLALTHSPPPLPPDVSLTPMPSPLQLIQAAVTPPPPSLLGVLMPSSQLLERTHATPHNPPTLVFPPSPPAQPPDPSPVVKLQPSPTPPHSLPSPAFVTPTPLTALSLLSVQLLERTHMSPCDPPPVLVFPPSQPAQPPDPTPVSSVKSQPPPTPSPSPLSLVAATPTPFSAPSPSLLQPLNRMRVAPRNHPPLLVFPPSPPGQPPDPSTLVSSAKSQPPPPPTPSPLSLALGARLLAIPPPFPAPSPPLLRPLEHMRVASHNLPPPLPITLPPPPPRPPDFKQGSRRLTQQFKPQNHQVWDFKHRRYRQHCHQFQYPHHLAHMATSEKSKVKKGKG